MKLHLEGQTFNYLTAIESLPQRYCSGTCVEQIWLCKCKCGNATQVRTGELTHGGTKSCGCKKRESKNVASKNGFWKGDEVGYGGLHDWVKSRLPRPDKCPNCGFEGGLDLANKGIYDRNLANWEYLCRECHMKKDGRLEALKLFRANMCGSIEEGKKNQAPVPTI